MHIHVWGFSCPATKCWFKLFCLRRQHEIKNSRQQGIQSIKVKQVSTDINSECSVNFWSWYIAKQFCKIYSRIDMLSISHLVQFHILPIAMLCHSRLIFENKNNNNSLYRSNLLCLFLNNNMQSQNVTHFSQIKKKKKGKNHQVSPFWCNILLILVLYLQSTFFEIVDI